MMMMMALSNDREGERKRGRHKKKRKRKKGREILVSVLFLLFLFGQASLPPNPSLFYGQEVAFGAGGWPDEKKTFLVSTLFHDTHPLLTSTQEHEREAPDVPML